MIYLAIPSAISPIRSRLELILRTASRKRRSMATGQKRANMFSQSRSILSSLPLTLFSFSTTSLARSLSKVRKAWRALESWEFTSVHILTASVFRSWSSVSICAMVIYECYVNILVYDRPAALRLTEPTRDIILGAIVFRIGEHDLCFIIFNQLAQIEEGRFIANPGSLLHVVRHDDQGIIDLQLMEELFHR